MEHIDADTPCVLLSNHGSLLDIPAVILPFPGRLRFVAKQELRAVPLFGRAMERAGVVFVDREHREKAIAQLAAARQRLSEGTSVWVAVEGRRTPDGSVGKFKKGGFHVALQLGVPIVPTWIEGTVDVLAPDQWVSVTGQTVRVRFGEPIPTRGVDLDELMARTRAAMLALAGASA
jgi:1-acyl-sn-glycerol-3-phosphate acyltransferase